MLIGPKLRCVWLLGFCVLVREELCDPLTSEVCIFVDMDIRSKCIPVCWMILLGRVLVWIQLYNNKLGNPQFGF